MCDTTECKSELGSKPWLAYSSEESNVSVVKRCSYPNVMVAYSCYGKICMDTRSKTIVE